uniref:Uncharacterized protein n=1 Tax=Anguilla anguilla TaxID=7936 RepID=A0A0E9SEC5_ANGAN
MGYETHTIILIIVMEIEDTYLVKDYKLNSLLI